jgi:hypothetical protein
MAINVREFIRQAWAKKDAEKKAKNILILIDNFNKANIPHIVLRRTLQSVGDWRQMSKLVQTDILQEESGSKRVALLGHWIDIAQVLFSSLHMSTCRHRSWPA